MASRRLGVGAITTDALSTEDIRLVEQPSILNVSASSVTNGDQLGIRLNKTVIMDDGEVNTVAGDIIDTDMDRLIANSFIGTGQLRASVPVLTTELQFWLQVEPVLGLGNGMF